MKKGLRLLHRVGLPFSSIQTRDLMKKGLRRGDRDGVAVFTIQTRDLMKKGLRPLMRRDMAGEGVFKPET